MRGIVVGYVILEYTTCLPVLYIRDNASLRNICFWGPRLMQEALQNLANVVLQEYCACRFFFV